MGKFGLGWVAVLTGVCALAPACSSHEGALTTGKPAKAAPTTAAIQQPAVAWVAVTPAEAATLAEAGRPVRAATQVAGALARVARRGWAGARARRRVPPATRRVSTEVQVVLAAPRLAFRSPAQRLERPWSSRPTTGPARSS